MSSLVKESLCRDSFLFHCFIDPDAVFRDDIPIVECMGHQDRCLKWFHVIEVITARPEVVVVSIDAIKTLGHFLVANIAVTELAF